MNFGLALDSLKSGSQIFRDGWNGKGMFLVYQKGYPDGIPINQNTADATGLPLGTVCKFTPYIMIRSADGSFGPWVPSQVDVLANDWNATPVGSRSTPVAP